MRWIESGQSAMMRAIDHGPAYLPADLFAGSPERVLAGMKVHANTISHARLVALEETFPRTREWIGSGQFNAHSRLFLSQPGVTANTLAEIGKGFDRFLIEQGDGAADLARFEWLWLSAYHAAEAEPLALGALAGLAPEALLERVLVRHPAARCAPFDQIVRDLIGAEVPDLALANAILITRPHAEVLVAPASALIATVLDATEHQHSIGMLLAQLNENIGDEAVAVDGVMRALVALINVGALISA